MKVLFCGDIVGRAGRDAVIKEVPRLRRELGLDFVAVNGENAAAGFGITAKICGELHDAGVDCITTGNHVWDQREIVPYIAQDKRLLRPINFPPGTPGWGANLFQTARGQKVVVINVMCRLFMDALDDPFRAVDVELAKYGLGNTAHFILVDVHGEATSEKQSIGHYCDGRVSAVLGTPQPCSHGRLLDPARRHRLPDRRRHVRRLRFGDRHEEGVGRAALRQASAGRAAVAGRRRGNFVRGGCRNRRPDRPRRLDPADPAGRPPAPSRSEFPHLVAPRGVAYLLEVA